MFKTEIPLRYDPFHTNRIIQRLDIPGPSQPLGCVPGKARLLIGDGRYFDTNAGQSPYPARRRRRVAEGKGGAAMHA